MSDAEPRDVARLRKALARLGDEPGWPDADDERLFSALHGEMSAEERRSVVDELIRNPQAAASWRLARELEPDRPARSSRVNAPVTWMSIAATVMIMAGAAWFLLPWRSEPPVFRGGEARAITSLLPEAMRLSRAEPVLRWTRIEGARYRVRVLTPELDLLDESEDTAVPEYRLPQAVLRGVPAGGRILWQVEARTVGSSAVVSPTFSALLE